MDRRPITDMYSVSGQLLPEDFARLSAEGVTTIINNRPDAEVPPELSGARMREAAEAAGLNYVELPVIGAALGPALGQEQGRAIAAASGPVHAYCGSGMRSAAVWALFAAETTQADDILAATAAAGYQLDGLRPVLASIADAKG